MYERNIADELSVKFAILSETSDFVNFERKYLRKWGDFSIEISALFRISSVQKDDVKSFWHFISTSN